MVAWGRNDIGQTNVPASVTNVIAISAGGQQSLALRKDGSVVQWGVTNAGNIVGATAIASGTNFHLALLTNGTVVAWGNNASGQTNVPSNLNGVVAIAAGGMHALALRTNGAVVAWGSNGSGESTVPSALTNVIAIAAGYGYSLALSNNGTLKAWGDNTNGQTALPPLANASVRAISAGGYQGFASIFSSAVQYPGLDVSKDLLLIYNTNSADSLTVLNYYLQHRPMVANASTLGVGGPYYGAHYETISQSDFTTQIADPLTSWLLRNPTKRPQYVILFLDVPSRVNDVVAYATNYPYYNSVPTPSVSARINSLLPGGSLALHT